MRSFHDLDLGDEVQIKQGEVDLAVQLIEQLSNERFQPEQYEDEYRQQVLKLVDQKVAGEEIVIAPSSEPREQIIDLVAALKKSLSDKSSDSAAKPKRARKAAKAKGGKRAKATRRKSASS
jgi:DNA end-binding protein Ku